MILTQLVIFRWDWLGTITRPYDQVRSAIAVVDLLQISSCKA